MRQDSQKLALVKKKIVPFSGMAKVWMKHMNMGVGFAVRNTLLTSQKVQRGSLKCSNLLLLVSSTFLVFMHQHYWPQRKDQFYDQLDDALKGVSPSEAIFVQGDFNGRVGADFDSWPNTVGHHGICKMNENGQRLLQFCSHHSLFVTNTFFQNRTCRKASWSHPCSQHWHQLYLVVTKQDSLNTVHITRAFHSADRDTDHALIISKVKYQPKRLHHAKPCGQPKISISRSKGIHTNAAFIDFLQRSLPASPGDTAEESWNSLKQVIFESSVLTYGKKLHTTTDCFKVCGHFIEVMVKNYENNSMNALWY